MPLPRMRRGQARWTLPFITMMLAAMLAMDRPLVAPALAAETASVDADHDGGVDSDEALIGVSVAGHRVLYVAPGGVDSAPGTYEQPLATLGKALKVAKGGEVVFVLPGSYPWVQVTTKYSSLVQIYGVPRGGQWPSVAGFEIWGAQHLAVRGVSFTATTQVTSHPTLKQAQPAADVTFENDEFTTPGHVCLRIRSGASAVRVDHSYLHDCSTGIGGPMTDQQSSGITIEDNHLRSFTADAIQFGAWDDVAINRNLIEQIRDPNGVVHNDAIQFTGRSHHMTIRGNVVRDSAQLLFVQPAFGPIDDVDVEDNLIYGARSYAVQIQGSTGVRFVHNTVWDSHYGGVLLREGTTPDGVVVPNDAVISDNVMSGYGMTGGARPSVFARNLVPTAPTISGDDIVVGEPRFRAPASGDFTLLADSPGSGFGARLAMPLTSGPGLLPNWGQPQDPVSEPAPGPTPTPPALPVTSGPPAPRPAPPRRPNGSTSRITQPTSASSRPSHVRRPSATHVASPARAGKKRHHATSRSRKLHTAESRLRREVRSLHRCLRRLSRVERRVLKMRARLGASATTSRRAVAKRLGLSRRRVKRIETRGLKQLRAAKRKHTCSGSRR